MPDTEIINADQWQRGKCWHNGLLASLTPKDKGWHRSSLFYHCRWKLNYFDKILYALQNLICFVTKQPRIKLLGKSDVAAVLFRPNGHFSEPAYSVKRLSLFLKTNPYRLLNWDTKTSFGWVNSSSSTAVRRLSSHHYEDKLSFPDFHFLLMEHLTQRE